MADNIIKRIIQLVLDRESAKKAQSEMDKVAEASHDKWKEVTKKIAEFLSVAFLTEKVIEFGKEAVKNAIKAEKAWVLLGNAVDAVGGSFTGIEEEVKASAEAFADATTHGYDEYIESLSRMITLTGDVAAAQNNMGLVANVAAQFFGGELAPAVDLVSKVMNGNITRLQRLGIHARDAADGLRILAERSQGAATKELATFGGQLSQLGNLWEHFLRDVGMAVVKNDDAVSSIGVLKNALSEMAKWVHENQDTLRHWVSDGIAFAIDATDVLIRAIWGMGDAITGGILVPLGAGAETLAFFVRALQGVANASAILDLALHNTDAFIKDSKAADDLKKQADALDDWGAKMVALGSDKVKKGIDVLSKPLFSSDQFKHPPKTEPLEVNDPMLGKNVSTEATKAVEKALKEFTEAGLAAANMQKILGDQFDATGAEVERTTKLLTVLAANGIDPASVGLEGLSDHFKELVTTLKPVHDALKTFREEEKAADNMHRILGDQFDATGAEIERTTKLLDVLAKAGIDPDTVGLGDLSGDLEVLVKHIKPTEDASKALAKSLKSDMAMATIDASSATFVLRQEQTALLGSIRELTESGIDPQSAKLQDLTKRYASVSQQINAISAQKTIDRLKQQQSDLGTAIKFLLSEGISPTSMAVQNLVHQFDNLSLSIDKAESVQKLAVIMKDLGDEIRTNTFMATLDQADALTLLQVQLDATRSAIQKMLADVNHDDAALQKLIATYHKLSEAIKAQTKLMQLQADVADVLAEALGFALQGGLHEAAVNKAKQNAIESAEWLVRAGAFALFGDGPRATAALHTAGEFAAVAAMWAAFAAVTSGGSSANAATSAGGAGGSSAAGVDLSGARSSSGDAANKAEPPKPDVTINLIGPGFAAMNPKVQEVVWGATQQAIQRFGPVEVVRVQKG